MLLRTRAEGRVQYYQKTTSDSRAIERQGVEDKGHGSRAQPFWLGSLGVCRSNATARWWAGTRWVAWLLDSLGGAALAPALSSRGQIVLMVVDGSDMMWKRDNKGKEGGRFPPDPSKVIRPVEVGVPVDPACACSTFYLHVSLPHS